MAEYEFTDSMGFIVRIEAESQEKANEKFDKYFNVKKVVIPI